MDIKSASGDYSPTDYNLTNITSSGNQPSVVRKGEFRINRALIQIATPLAHILLSFTLAITLVFFLDNRHFDSGKRVSWSGSFAETSLRASDVTTLVSVALVLVRAAGQALIVSMVWRCAMILLQHGGLSLGQLDKMLSYRIPTSLSGKYSLPIAIALLMILPSAYVAPILSGSVNWQGLVLHDTFPAGFGSRPGSESSDYWQRFRTDFNVRWEVTRKGLAHASILWADIGPSSREARVQDHRFRYIAKQESVVGTIVEQAPVPYIKVESVAWDKVWTARVEEILETDESNERFYTSLAIVVLCSIQQSGRLVNGSIHWPMGRYLQLVRSIQQSRTDPR